MIYMLNSNKANNEPEEYGDYFSACVYDIDTRDSIDIDTLSPSILYTVLEKDRTISRIYPISNKYYANTALQSLLNIDSYYCTSWVETDLLIPIKLLKKVTCG